MLEERAPQALPLPACDCHTHVFGPIDRFPFSVATNYTPPDSPFERHSAMLRAHGIDRAVLIQPVPYQTDNSAIVDAIARSAGSLRGIGVQTGSADDAQLRRLKDQGICGLRFNEMRNPNGQGRYQGAVGVEHLQPLAGAMRNCDLHAQIWADTDTCVALAASLKHLGLPLVFDHMAGLDAGKGVAQPAFQSLLRLLAAGDIWIKLTICRVSKAGHPDYADVRPFHDALVRENPERLLWGSDFPFVRMEDRMPDFGRLIELFLDWTPTSATRRILVENPARLFGFNQPPFTAHS
jgi:2-pyrone-4,6-dicarboxylate lactonase